MKYINILFSDLQKVIKDIKEEQQKALYPYTDVKELAHALEWILEDDFEIIDEEPGSVSLEEIARAIIYTTNNYTTTYDIIKDADHIPTLEEWLHDIESDDEREQAKEALKTGCFSFVLIKED